MRLTVKLMVLLLVCILTLVSICFTSFAKSKEELVVDDANLLTASEEDELEEMLYKYSKKHECELVVYTVEYVTNAKTSAENFYDNNGYGYGKDNNGVLLLISETNRTYYICLTGKATEIFSYSRLDDLEREVVNELKNDKYYEACLKFAKKSDSIIDSYNGFYLGDFIPAIIFTVIISIGTGVITILIMRRKMNNARPQKAAHNYVKYGSFELTLAKDVYLYSTITRVPRVKKTNSSGGGGSRPSHSGRGGSF